MTDQPSSFGADSKSVHDTSVDGVTSQMNRATNLGGTFQHSLSNKSAAFAQSESASARRMHTGGSKNSQSSPKKPVADNSVLIDQSGML